MRFAFIDAEKVNYPVRVLCRVLEVSRSGYYAWRGREPSDRVQEDAVLSHEIRVAHKESRGTYGCPRVTEKIRRERPVSRKRVARLMRANGLRGCAPRAFRATTDSDHDDRWKRCLAPAGKGAWHPSAWSRSQEVPGTSISGHAISRSAWHLDLRPRE